MKESLTSNLILIKPAVTYEPLRIWWTLKHWEDALTNGMMGILVENCWKCRRQDPKGNSGPDAISDTANSDRGESIGITAFFENVSRKKKQTTCVEKIDNTRNHLPDEVSESSVPRTYFDRQPHTYHMVTGLTAEANPTPDFLTGRILTPYDPPSHHHQNFLTKVSQDHNLIFIEQTPKNQLSNSKNSISRVAEAYAGITSQQPPQAATILEQESLNILIFDGKNVNFDFFERLKPNS